MPKESIKAFSTIGSAKLWSKGESRGPDPGIESVQNFLMRFGYMRGVREYGVLDDETSAALTRYQDRNGLPKTGNFDSKTQSEMTTTRCAMPDNFNSIAFFSICPWNNRELKYSFHNGSGDVPNDDAFQAVRNAFRSWQAQGQLTFTEVDIKSQHDIEIDWRNADDPDHSMVGGTLAHADFPLGCGVVTNILPKPVHFDDSEHVWSVGASPGAFDIETVALHEIGHIIGLGHSSVTGAVMRPTVASNFTLRNLQPDDINGIRNLYP